VGLQITYRSNQLQPCAYGSLCVVFVCLRVAEVDQNPVAHVLGYEPAEALHRLGNTLLVAANNLAQVFRVHAGRERRGAHKVREHHRHLTALGTVFGRGAWGTRRGRCANGGRLTARLITQGRDGIQQLHAVPKR